MTPNKESMTIEEIEEYRSKNRHNFHNAINAVKKHAYLDATYNNNLDELNANKDQLMQCLYNAQGEVRDNINLKDLRIAINNLNNFFKKPYNTEQLKDLYNCDLRDNEATLSICQNLEKLKRFTTNLGNALTNDSRSNYKYLSDLEDISLEDLNNIAFAEKALVPPNKNLSQVLKDSYQSFHKLSEEIQKVKLNKPEFPPLDEKNVELICEYLMVDNEDLQHKGSRGTPYAIDTLTQALKREGEYHNPIIIKDTDAKKIAEEVYNKMKKVGAGQKYGDLIKKDFIDALIEKLVTFFKSLSFKQAPKVEETKHPLDREKLKSGVKEVLTKELKSSFSEKVSISPEQNSPAR